MSDKSKLIITGYSDDIISFDGSIYDEINPNNDEAVLSLPQCGKFKVFYDSDGIWRISVIEPYTLADCEIISGKVEDDTNDVLTIDAPIAYLLWESGDEKGFVGNLKFSEETERKYKLLIDFAMTGYGIDDKPDTVKAIIEGLI